MSKPLYISISNRDPGDCSVVNGVNEVMCISTTFKKAYEMGLFVGKINDPDLSYRQALTRYKDEEHVYIRPKGEEHDENAVLITRINQY